jgi:hypothetical protein
VTIRRELLDVSGIEVGATMILEAYADGIIRMFLAGDLMSRGDEMV